MADEPNDQIKPLTDDEATALANRLDDTANPLTTNELDSLDTYYVKQDEAAEGGDADAGAGAEGEAGDADAGKEGDDKPAGGDPLELAIAEKNKANQFAGKQSYELGQERKKLDAANAKIAELEKKGGKPGAAGSDDQGKEFDPTDQVQLDKYTDDRIKTALDTQRTEQDKINLANSQKDANYNRGKTNLEGLQTTFKGKFDTKEPIAVVVDKVAAGHTVDPEDAKIAEKVTFLNQWGRDRNIFNLAVANREFMRAKGQKDDAALALENRGRENLVNDINESENINPVLTDVSGAEGKKVMTIDDLGKEEDQRKVLDGMTEEEVIELEKQIQADETLSLTGG